MSRRCDHADVVRVDAPESRRRTASTTNQPLFPSGDVGENQRRDLSNVRL